MLDLGHPEWFEGLEARRLFSLSSEAVEELTSPRLLDLHPGLQVVDIGCGWGHLGHLLRTRLTPGGKVWGFDLEDEQVEKGRLRARASRSTAQLRFEAADGARLPVPDARFDRAVCQTVLMHQSRPEDLLHEMARVVRPGGRVTLIEPDRLDASSASTDCVDRDNPDQLERRLAVEETVLRGIHNSGGGDYRIGNRLEALATNTGFAEVRTWLPSEFVSCRPPYGPDQALFVQYLSHTLSDQELEERQARWAPLFLAGGGEHPLWKAWLSTERTLLPERQRRLREGSYEARFTAGLVVCSAQVAS